MIIIIDVLLIFISGSLSVAGACVCVVGESNEGGLCVSVFLCRVCVCVCVCVCVSERERERLLLMGC